jgi:hypothetical protein
MQTIVETEVFIKSAERAGIAENELDTIRCFLAKNPEAGEPHLRYRGSQENQVCRQRQGEKRRIPGHNIF